MKLLLAALLLMTPSIFAQESVPADTGGGSGGAGSEFNASAMLDRVLEGGGGAAVAEEGAPGESQGSENDTDPYAGEQPAEEVNVEEGVDSTGDAEPLVFGDEIGAPVVVKGPNGDNLYQWPEKAAHAIQSQVKFASELQNAIPDITVDDAIAHNEAYTDLYRLGHDLRAGTPDSVRRVGQMILNETGGGSGFANLAQTMVQHVKATNPQAYGQISTMVESDIESELYQAAQEAANHPDPNVREGYRVLAEMFAFHRNGGNFKPVAEFAKPIDPLEQRIQRAEQLERQHQERVRADGQRQTQAWQGAARSESANGLKKAVEDALAPHVKRYDKDPNLKPMILNHVIGQVRSKLKADNEWAARFEVQYGQALQERSKQSVQRIVDQYLARAKGVLKRELPKMLSSASNAVVEQSRDRHETLRKATDSSHRLPGGTGAPVKQTIARKASSFDSPEAYRQHIAKLLD